MLSVLRGRGPLRSTTASNNPLVLEDGSARIRFNGPESRYFMTHEIPSNSSMLNPPEHVHFWQTEYFRVTTGTGIWHCPSHPDPSMRTIVKRAGDEPIHLPAGIPHSFENASSDSMLVTDIRIEPETEPRGVEERFFRNFFSYLEDCKKQGLEPSLFQLCLFLLVVDSALALPVPGPNWFKLWISKAFGLIMGIGIGEWLLGYQRSYPEYYQEGPQ